jgi:lipoyl(octanoyl) transferase
MLITDLGTLAYRDAWRLQEAAHEEVLAGWPERILLVEHPPVITLGRRADRGEAGGGGMVVQHLVASPEYLQQLGVELVQSDRGGDITFLGPGQIVAYPIVRLNDHGLSVGGYVRALERTVIATLADFEISARRDESAVGVWVDDSTTGTPAKVCAIGVRIRRGISLHGLALNVTTDLSYFNLIVPCGLAGRPVTSVRKLLGEAAPPIERVRETLARRLIEALAVRPTEEITTEARRQ